MTHFYSIRVLSEEERKALVFAACGLVGAQKDYTHTYLPGMDLLAQEARGASGLFASGSDSWWKPVFLGSKTPVLSFSVPFEPTIHDSGRRLALSLLRLLGHDTPEGESVSG